MEAKPHLPASTQRMVVALRGGEKGTANWGVPVWREREKTNQQRLRSFLMSPTLRPRSHGTDFHIKYNTFVVVQPFAVERCGGTPETANI